MKKGPYLYTDNMIIPENYPICSLACLLMPQWNLIKHNQFESQFINSVRKKNYHTKISRKFPSYDFIHPTFQEYRDKD